MPKRSSKSKDVNQIASLIIQEATQEPSKTPTKEKNPNAVALGKLGGLKGGPARAKKLSSQKRRDIARKAALSRWKR